MLSPYNIEVENKAEEWSRRRGRGRRGLFVDSSSHFSIVLVGVVVSPALLCLGPSLPGVKDGFLQVRCLVRVMSYDKRAGMKIPDQKLGRQGSSSRSSVGNAPITSTAKKLSKTLYDAGWIWVVLTIIPQCYPHTSGRQSDRQAATTTEKEIRTLGELLNDIC